MIDLSSSAVKSIELNINYNKSSNKVKAQESNAITHMATNPSAYHIIDLDRSRIRAFRKRSKV